MTPSQETALTATYDPDVGAPRCAVASHLCSSGNLLLGVGSSEPNTPNTIDQCEGEGSNSTDIARRQEESVDQIIVRATDRGVITAGNEVEVEVTLSSAEDASTRSVPFKSSVAHVYFASNALEGHASWEFLESFVVDPGSGKNLVRSFRFFVPHYDDESDENGTVQANSTFHSSAIRVSYGYAQYDRNQCASDGIEDLSYLDVDDLVFEVREDPVFSSSHRCRWGTWAFTFVLAVVVQFTVLF